MKVASSAHLQENRRIQLGVVYDTVVRKSWAERAAAGVTVRVACVALSAMMELRLPNGLFARRYDA